MRTAILRICAVLVALAGAAFAPARAPAGSWLGMAPGTSGAEFRLVEPTTGNSILLLGSGLGAVGSGAMALNPTGKRLYVAGVAAGTTGPMRLQTIDPQAPAVLADVPLDQMVAGLFVRDDGVLFGLVWNRDMSYEEFRAIDPATGISTPYGVIAAYSHLLHSAIALDSQSHRLYVTLAFDSAPSKLMLYVIDTYTTAVLGAPTLDRRFVTLQVRGDRNLVGMCWNGTEVELRLINTADGSSTLIRKLPGFALLAPAVSAIDPSTNRLYQAGYAATSTDPPRLYGVDAAGGAYWSDVASSRPFVTLDYSPLDPTIAVEPPADAPEFAASGPHPNPFRDHTTLSYSLPAESDVTLVVFDLAGRLVRRLVDGREAAGTHTVIWNGCDERGARTRSGMYFGVLRAGDYAATRKMFLVE